MRLFRNTARTITTRKMVEQQQQQQKFDPFHPLSVEAARSGRFSSTHSPSTTMKAARESYAAKPVMPVLDGEARSTAPG